jgi:hypothetical protein
MDELKTITPHASGGSPNFSALCVWRLSMDSMAAVRTFRDGTTTQHMTERTEAIRRETGILMTIVQKFRQSKPQSSLVHLRETVLCLLKNALIDLPLTPTFQNLDTVCNQFLRDELQLIPSHAQMVGLEDQLQDLVDLDPALPQVGYEDVLQFYKPIFLPTLQPRFPRLSIYMGQLGVAQELIDPGQDFGGYLALSFLRH